ncbi:sulfotransferase [Sphingomonas sp. CBMAI 2297]|uniref:sulfotransferase n=1 Tax=Sphingomonas sp. CBMAI 2297 TaxID=2991720 RepID=UPI002454989F|nr:sulfotransferase [Sphingomonas sp. CBMAI 2297]MDH4744100.1 sulfotransferase [Sphingomonas sp. CBMAI 2297]
MYSGADRLLHRIALGSPALLEATFDIERATHRGKIAAVPIRRPVFIAGLARAGTSILTRLLHQGGGFAAPSYRDLPFPLAPNSWARLGGKRHVEASERGHGDGLTHDLDSPEAIEEVFWRALEGRRYLRRDGLAPAAPDPETLAAFRDYVRLVLLRHGGARYLSKNNNNILRLEGLATSFPDALLIHPFRDPLQQALSLLSQHRRAARLAGEDPFRRRFMTWLGHHEFGADHRPFLFDGAPGRDEDPTRADYWLKLWDSVHRALLSAPARVRERQFFVDYDALCASPRRYAPRLAVLVEAPIDSAALRAADSRHAEADPALLARVAETHAALRACFRARFD